MTEIIVEVVETAEVEDRPRRRGENLGNWRGRQPKKLRDTNSFQTFVSRARGNKSGQDHLRRHHGGYGL